MSDTDKSADALTRTLNSYDAERAIYDALVAKVLERNKATLFDALAAIGVSHVLVSFDGYGDSGQIESVDAFAGDEGVDLPDTRVEIARAYWGDVAPEPCRLPLAGAIETVAFHLLEDNQGGWETGAGAYGEFTFTVAERAILLDHNDRFETSEHSERRF